VVKKIIQSIIGRPVYYKLEHIKKKYFPTIYDKLVEKEFKRQIEFYRPFIKPGNLCFDIGGNMGFKTRVFLQLKAKVLVLEPQKKCVEIIKAKYGSKVTVLQKGAGAINEIKEFFISYNSELSSFNEDWIEQFKETRFVGAKVKAVEKIEIVTIDSLIEQFGEPHFIKIDVEGYELEVLKGLSRPFKYLSFEYVVPERTNQLLDALYYLQKNVPSIVCNYDSNRANKLALEEWLPIGNMIEYVQQDNFIATLAGDIYIRANS